VHDAIVTNTAVSQALPRLPPAPLRPQWDTMVRPREVQYLEAVGRTLAGIAPWLELSPQDITSTAELKAHNRATFLALRTIESITDPESPDALCFDLR
jgi:hypothetical protein